MYINNVPKLASIWEGVVHAGSLARLKALTLYKYLSLKKIFSKGMIAQLSRLQNLKIKECSEIESVITLLNKQVNMEEAPPWLHVFMILYLLKKDLRVSLISKKKIIIRQRKMQQMLESYDLEKCYTSQKLFLKFAL